MYLSKIAKCVFLDCKMYLSKLLRLFFFHPSFAELALSPILLMKEEISHHAPIIYNSLWIVKYIILFSSVSDFQIPSFQNKNHFLLNSLISNSHKNFAKFGKILIAQNITNRGCMLKISKSLLTYLNQTNAA